MIPKNGRRIDDHPTRHAAISGIAYLSFALQLVEKSLTMNKAAPQSLLLTLIGAIEGNHTLIAYIQLVRSDSPYYSRSKEALYQ